MPPFYLCFALQKIIFPTPAAFILILTSNQIHPIQINIIDTGSLSDHKFVQTRFTFDVPVPEYQERTTRCWSKLDQRNFKSKLAHSSLKDYSSIHSLDLDTLVDTYNSVLTRLLDDNVPKRAKVCQVRNTHSYQWFDDECKELKTVMRQLERNYRRTKSPQNQELWREAQKAYRCARERKNEAFILTFIITT